MPQGFKKSLPTTNNNAKKEATQSVQKKKKQLKRGARFIKPKKAAAVEATLMKRQLTSEHIKQSEQVIISKMGKKL